MATTSDKPGGGDQSQPHGIVHTWITILILSLVAPPALFLACSSFGLLRLYGYMFIIGFDPSVRQLIFDLCGFEDRGGVTMSYMIGIELNGLLYGVIICIIVYFVRAIRSRVRRAKEGETDIPAVPSQPIVPNPEATKKNDEGEEPPK